MNWLDIIRAYGGKMYHREIRVDVPNTVYGAIITRFEDDKFDIQMTCIGKDNLEEVLKILTEEKC